MKSNIDNKILSLKNYKDHKLAIKLYDDLKELIIVLAHQVKVLEKYKKYKSAKKAMLIMLEEIDILTANAHQLLIIIENNKKGKK